MDWKDDNGVELKLYDYVLINNIRHQILLQKIGKKNRMVFVHCYRPNVLVEYHFMFYKHARTLGIIKVEPYENPS